MTPQHLQRLGLISDSELIDQNPVNSLKPAFLDSNYYNYRKEHTGLKQRQNGTHFNLAENMSSPQPINTFDLSLLLRMALSKIPQIPFEYILDVFRWDLFAGKIPMERANGYFWHLVNKHQGVGTPAQLFRDHSELFDAGAKFHVADNTPFVRFV